MGSNKPEDSKNSSDFVKYIFIGMCKSPKYGQLSATEKRGIIAGLKGVEPDRIYRTLKHIENLEEICESSAKNQTRTIETVFWTAQTIMNGLCYDPATSKLPLPEKYKITARVMGINLQYASKAIRAVARFSRFKKFADPYFIENPLNGDELFEFVQYTHVWAPKQDEYKDKLPVEVDKMMAGWVGCGESTIRAASIGSGDYEVFKKHIDARNVRRKQSNSENMFDKIRNRVLEKLQDRKFAALPKYKQNEIIAKEDDINCKPSTVEAVRNGYGCYGQYGNEQYKKDMDERIIDEAEKVRADYKQRLQDSRFAKLIHHSQIEIIAHSHRLPRRKVKYILLGKGIYRDLTDLVNVP